ncbi:unnamed protein product, partial [Prorocentrum cordatum]
VKQIKSTSCPTKGPYTFARLHEEFVITNFKEVYPRFQMYYDADLVCKTLCTLNAYTDFKEMMDPVANYLSNAATLEVVLANMADVVRK